MAAESTVTAAPNRKAYLNPTLTEPISNSTPSPSPNQASAAASATLQSFSTELTPTELVTELWLGSGVRVGVLGVAHQGT